MYGEIEKILPSESIYYNEPLYKHTTFKIGGPADVLTIPQSEAELVSLIRHIKQNNIRFIVIGNGSNILFPDEGYRGIVIKLAAAFAGISAENENDSVLQAKAGTLLVRLANAAYERGLTGLEFAAGIPGSVGGAILMNAGAYGGDISQIVLKSTYLDLEDCSIKSKDISQHAFSYRHSTYQNSNQIILSGVFQLSKGNLDEIGAKMKDFNARRIEKQPLEFPSAGSAFRRPAGYYAGQLIDECGLRGYRCGGAMISEKHCGFIINYNNATCRDVLHVIEYVQKTVFEQKGVMLEPEVRIIEG